MDQSSPGDETAWEKIKTWIDESYAFILILGGRYGSIEPEPGKSSMRRAERGFPGSAQPWSVAG
jgi:hypothetical protein